MKKIIKISLWTLLGLVVLISGALGLFIYKVGYGFPVSFETEVPQIDFPTGKTAVLLFSKATGFVHQESIDAGKKHFAQMAKKNDWFLYETEEGGIFNAAQLAKFDLVIFNNSTGRVLNDEQQEVLQNYVEAGGNLLGVHGAGDNSHHWDWYTENLLGTTFSHHSLNPQLQEAVVMVDKTSNPELTLGLPSAWTHTEEWYVFFENPGTKGFQILMSIDGESILPSGNILFIKGKDFGMGKDHPVAWYKQTGKGNTFYTSLGHAGTVWNDPAFNQFLENVVEFSGRE